jgi:hypothetical protein
MTVREAILPAALPEAATAGVAARTVRAQCGSPFLPFTAVCIRSEEAPSGHNPPAAALSFCGRVLADGYG